MPTVTPLLRGSKPIKQIHLRISDATTNRYVSLGLMVHPKHWSTRKDAKTFVKSSLYEADQMNELIRQAVSDLASIEYGMKLTGRRVTAARLQEAYRAKQNDTAAAQDFFSFADSIVESFVAHGQFHTANRYRSIFKKLKAYRKGRRLPFDEINPGFIRRYRAHLAKHYGNSKSTQITNLNAVRAVCNRAIEEGLADRSWYPFVRGSVGTCRTVKDKLTFEQVMSMATLELDPAGAEPLARDSFVLSFYLGGVRFGDLCLLRHRDIHRVADGAILRYLMSKNGKLTEVPICAAAAEIIKRYERDGKAELDDLLLPLVAGKDLSTREARFKAIRSANFVVNRALKRVAKAAGITVNVSTHLARHSFAAHALRQGWGMNDIRDSMRHSDISTTESYTGDLGLDRLIAEHRKLFPGPSDEAGPDEADDPGSEDTDNPNGPDEGGTDE